MALIEDDLNEAFRAGALRRWQDVIDHLRARCHKLSGSNQQLQRLLADRDAEVARLRGVEAYLLKKLGGR